MGMEGVYGVNGLESASKNNLHKGSQRLEDLWSYAQEHGSNHTPHQTSISKENQ